MSLWLKAEIATDAEVESLRALGTRVTVFVERLGAGGSTEQALETIYEHHPDEILWLEGAVPGESKPPVRGGRPRAI